ncbi:hypothetical protein HK103_005465 [Boothiomyces macroporosus]|uniref:Uncharacterized protein n=1 Tax=Boothiomyces macroporosus TaxID=261099 RepID=A0AAD5UI81_9FUNG|nr:hypothetical protein HK103_005465 [Boothiomyces macroporosus]
MPAIASTIFKIRADSDFIASADQPELLSFRKGQPFYALAADFEKGLYFVSTQFAVPFSRTAVSGMVPMEHFSKVDLHSKDPPVSRKKVTSQKPVPKVIHTQPTEAVPAAASNQAQDTQSIPVPVRRQSLAHNPEWNDVTKEPVTFVEVLTMRTDKGVDTYCIKVVRQKVSHIINRSVLEFTSLFTSINQIVVGDSICVNYPLSHPSKDAKMQGLELYLNHLISTVFANSTNAVLFQARDKFFNPKDSQEFTAGQPVRRDSGTSQGPSKQPYSPIKMPSVNPRISLSQKPKLVKKPSAFSKLSMLMFGSN